MPKDFIEHMIPKPDKRLVGLALIALAETLKQNAAPEKPKTKKKPTR